MVTFAVFFPYLGISKVSRMDVGDDPFGGNGSLELEDYVGGPLLYPANANASVNVNVNEITKEYKIVVDASCGILDRLVLSAEEGLGNDCTNNGAGEEEESGIWR